MTRPDGRKTCGAGPPSPVAEAAGGHGTNAGSRSASVLVIGIGNRCRSDDGVGPVVAGLIAARRLPGVRAVEHSGEGAGLMALWDGWRRVVIVDAARSGSPPGTVHRLDARAQRVPGGLFNYSTHAFSVAEAVEMARVLGTLPERLVVYGIEARDIGCGQMLSPPVEAAAESVAQRIAEELACMNSP